jgi:bifunctional non-homologous end joining protein LigD
MSKIQIHGHTIDLSHTDKVFFPESGITKGDLIDYYRKIGDIMIPHMKDRPVTMHRFPDGIQEEGFYQKEMPEYYPSWIDHVTIKKKENGENVQAMCNHPATLIYLANQGVITPHVWLSRIDNLHKPDKLVFDLDPPADDFESVRFAAHALYKMLHDMEVKCYIMTTGSKGLHVVIPLDCSASFDVVRSFAEALGTRVAALHPERLTMAQRKKKRGNRLFLDMLRNSYAQTSVTPYAVRALEKAPVATPLHWKELHNKDLHSQTYTISSIFRRLGQKEDPWKDMGTQSYAIDDLKDRLQDLDSSIDGLT